MAPPPVTPSPHRFIIKKQAPVRPIQQPTPLSGTQQQFNSTPRFNTTPRFTNPTSSQRPVQNTHPISSPLIARAATPAHRPSRLQETIEDDFPEDEELDDVQQSIEDDIDISDRSVRHEIIEDDETSFPRSAAKRQRLNSSPLPDLYRELSDTKGQDAEEDLDELDGLSSSIPEISSPTAPLPLQQSRNQTQSRPIPRFLPPSTPQSRFQTAPGIPSTPLSSSAYLHHPPSTNIKSDSTQTIFSRPPRFRPPSPTSQSHAGADEDPLPDTFSPRRRGGEKYVIGGLANEVRSWIFNIGNEHRSGMHEFASNKSSSSNTVTARTGGQVGKDTDHWKSKILIDEISGGYGASGAGLTLIRGRQIHSQPQVTNPSTIVLEGGLEESIESPNSTCTEVKLLLAGTGIVDGLNRAKKVGAGMQVGIRGPTWEILVGGEKWHVAVNWRVL